MCTIYKYNLNLTKFHSSKLMPHSATVQCLLTVGWSSMTIKSLKIVWHFLKSYRQIETNGKWRIHSKYY